MSNSSASSTYNYSLDSKSDYKSDMASETTPLRYVDGPSSSPTRGEKSRKAKLFSMLTGGSSPPKNSRDKPAFVVGGSRIDPKSHAKRTGPAFVVGGARVEPSTQPKHKTGPDFVVGGARIEPSSWPKNSGPFVVGGARVEPRR